MSLQRMGCATFVLALAGALTSGCSSGGGSPKTYSVSGKVTGATDVTLSLSGSSTASATTDASGNYGFTGLANGSYAVTPTKSGYTFSPASTTVTVKGADETGKDFAASAVISTHAISGKVTGASGVKVDLSGANTGNATTDANGNYSFTGLANGSYTVTPNKAGYTFSPRSIAINLIGANVTGRDFTAALVTHVISGSVTGATGDAMTMV